MPAYSLQYAIANPTRSSKAILQVGWPIAHAKVTNLASSQLLLLTATVTVTVTRLKSH